MPESDTPAFYRAFEDRHRGPQAMIRARLEAYLPVVTPFAQLHPQHPVIDLGCGRGEWLALLREQRILARGCDLDAQMLAACHDQDLAAEQVDALEFLAAQADGSAAMITAFHVAEHLPFERLMQLVAQAHRVLRPGGALLLETPNPENLVTGSCNFYMDPTHQRPLPPPLLAFLPDHLGFARVTTLRLHEHPKVQDGSPLALIDVLAGVSPDYAVIAQKATLSGPPPDLLAAIRQTFRLRTGVTLNDLADRYEAQNQQALQDLRQRVDGAVGPLSQSVERQAQHTQWLQVHLEDALQKQSARFDTQLQDFASHFQQTLEQVHGLLLQSQARLEQSQARIEALQASTSWRVTRPLRWLGGQVLALRQQGLGVRLRKAARKLLRIASGAPAAHAPAAAPARSEDAPFRVSAWSPAAGSTGHAAPSATAAPATASPVIPADLGPRARQLHAQLREAMARAGARTDTLKD